MKILACTDGSVSSQKALEVAATIAEGCNPDEVAIIHVHSPPDIAYWESLTQESDGPFSGWRERHKVAALTLLSEATKIFAKKNIEAATIIEQGHPSQKILQVASEKGFDMIVLGSRGMGGLQKVLLGSVSSAVVQEAENCSVLTVK